MADRPRFNIGLTQWRVTRDIRANLAVAEALVHRCAADGADLVLLPENCLCLGTNAEMRAAALSLASAELRPLADVARQMSVPVLLGGLKRRLDDGVVRNSAVLFDRLGQVAAVYDKIHLFDARINGQTFEASIVEQAGAQPVLVEIAGAAIGVTICYDVRFPELYRRLALAGADILLVPSAFTQTTGLAHWETLLRARAIENGCFVAASATVRGNDGRDAFETYGHALAVDPWGRVLTDLGTEDSVSRVVTLDLALVDESRSRLPVLKGVRPEAYKADPLRVTLQGGSPGA